VAIVSWCDWDTFLDEGAASMTDSLRRMRRVVAGSPVWQIMVFIVVLVVVMLAGEYLGLIPA
jgi:hypothetical protein